MSEYDFAVIGGGSAGYNSARVAASLGLKTIVIDGAPEVGGLCILRGCMPSKTLIESANRLLSMRHANEFGLHAENLSFDGDAIIARKRRLIGEFADDRRKGLESGKFDFVRGRGVFRDAHTVDISLLDGTSRSITSRYFLLATGSVINSPDIPGLAESSCLTSDDVLDLAEVPKSIIVLGAGPVALELAHYFNGLGRKVTVIQRSGQLLTGVDPDVAAVVEKVLRRRGVEIFTNTKLQKVEREGEISRVTFLHDGREIRLEAAAVLNALGRKPNTSGLGLEKAGVVLKGGHIASNLHQQTSTPHIFAAGDCTGPYEIVHIAVEQGELAARNAAALKNDAGATLESTDYRLKLFAVFTEPQVAAVGLSELEAKEQGLDYLAAQYPFDDHGKSLVMDEKDGFVKLLADKKTGEIIGGSVVGPHASDLIHEVAVAMRFRSTAAQFAAIPHYHPTLSEIWTYPAADLAEETRLT